MIWITLIGGILAMGVIVVILVKVSRVSREVLCHDLRLISICPSFDMWSVHGHMPFAEAGWYEMKHVVPCSGWDHC